MNENLWENGRQCIECMKDVGLLQWSFSVNNQVSQTVRYPIRLLWIVITTKPKRISSLWFAWWQHARIAVTDGKRTVAEARCVRRLTNRARLVLNQIASGTPASSSSPGTVTSANISINNNTTTQCYGGGARMWWSGSRSSGRKWLDVYGSWQRISVMSSENFWTIAVSVSWTQSSSCMHENVRHKIQSRG